MRYIWPAVSHWIFKSIDKVDLLQSEAVERQVLDGVARLWVVHNGVFLAAVVTEVYFVESGKICAVVACGGEGVLAALELLEQIEKYAKQEGCRSIIVCGRKGWARALKDYRQAAVVLRKELN